MSENRVSNEALEAMASERYWPTVRAVAAELIDARADIERLTREREHMEKASIGAMALRDEAHREIERLHAALAKERNLACKRQAEIDRLNRDGSELRQRIAEYDQSYRDQSDVIRRLTRERDMHEAEAKRQHYLLNQESLRADNAEASAANLQVGIDTLTRERDECRSAIPQYLTAIEAQQQETNRMRSERDEARELLREFRVIWDSPLSAMQAGEAWEDCCKKYDARFGQPEQPQPEPVEWVPWTAETRPKGPMTIRRRDNHSVEVPPQWGFDGAHVNYDTLFAGWEWSRDGQIWQKCGVPRG